MASLPSQGFRFLANPGRSECRWVNPALVSTMDGWTDVTDLNDEEFLSFVTTSAEA